MSVVGISYALPPAAVPLTSDLLRHTAGRVATEALAAHAQAVALIISLSFRPDQQDAVCQLVLDRIVAELRAQQRDRAAISPGFK